MLPDNGGRSLLLMGGLLEDVGDLHEPFLLGYARKIGITVAGLALACERLQQILLRSCSLETLHQIPSLSIFIKRHPINAPGVVLLNVMTVIAYFYIDYILFGHLSIQ